MKIILSLLILAFAFLGFSQNLNITNQFHFGGSLNDYISTMLISPNNDGYYFIGGSNSGISGNKTEISRGGNDIWILKTDNNFNVLWDKTIGGGSEDYFWSAKLFNNKIYISSHSMSGVSGEKSLASYGNSDIWLLCLDLNATILWQAVYGGTNDEIYPEFIEYKTNSILMVCASDSPISGNKTVGTHGYTDIWLLELDKNTGAILNQKNIGSNGTEYAPSIVKLNQNNNIYISCISESGSVSGDRTDPGFDIYSDVWMVKLDSNLNILQDKCFGGDGLENSVSISEKSDYIFMACNTTSNISGNKTAPAMSPNSGYTDGWLLKLDNNLNIIWDKSYGGLYGDYIAPITANANGNLILSLSSESGIGGNKTSPSFGGYDNWLVITDHLGNILTQKSYGGNQFESGVFLPYPNSDQDLLLLSNSDSGISGNKTVPSYGGTDLWIAKINASNFLNTESLTHPISTITASPNPFQKTVRFQFSEQTENTVLSIYAVDGKKVFEQAIQPGTTYLEWQAETTGQMFFYELRGNETFVQGKLVKM